MTGSGYRSVIGILRVLIGLSLLALLLYKSDLMSFSFVSDPVSIDLIIIGVIFLVMSFFVMGMRLHVMVSRISLSFFNTSRQFLIGWFFTNILPTNFGGDGYLIYYYKDKAGSTAAITAIVTFQRIMGIIILLAYASFFSLMNPGFIAGLILKFNLRFMGNSTLYIILIGFAILLLLILYILYKNKIEMFLEKYLKGLRNISFREFILTLSLSVLYQLMRLAGFYLLLRAFGQTVNPFSLFFVLVMVTLISILPVSVGGLGVQESIFTLGLSSVGIPVPLSVIAALINRGIFILMALTGWIFFMFDKKNRKSKI